MDAMADRAAFAEAVVFLSYFDDLPDPRQRGKVVYPLDEVLLLALLAVLAGAETFVGIARFGAKKLALLRRFRPFRDGTPSHDHLGDIFAAVDAEAFQRCFVAWVASLVGTPAEVIAIDGKTARRSGQKTSGKAPIHMVSAFAARQRLVLGPVKVAEKSNEIVAIPKLLDLMAIEGAVVTIDAIGGQRDIARTILDQKADAVRAKVDSTANMLGVTDVLQKYPRQMSGGQRQRVAAARAIVADPKLVLADEPTGALDSRNAAVLLETLEVLNAKLHATIMMVTHDAVAASYADRILFIKDGKLFNELRRGDDARTDFYQRILEVQAFLSGKQGDSPAVGFAPSHAAKPRN